jgi:hypothetical protein
VISRFQLTALILAAILGGILLFTAPLRAADPRPIACPNGQTVFLEGRAIPNEALLVYLADRAVGGGLASSSGSYRLPLRVQERPGSYPVEVRLRSSRAVVERFTCFVDVPVGDAGETPTTEPVVTAGTTRSATTQSTATRAATQGATTPQPTGGTRTTTATSNGTRTITPTRGSPTVTPTGPTATTTTTGTAGPSPTVTTTTSGTSAAAANDVEIVFVQLLEDPAFPDEEFVELENQSGRPITITGWQLRNASRSTANPYVFPTFVFEEDFPVLLYSTAGTNDIEDGDFYWGQTPPLWQAGDRAELRDAQGNLIHSYVVEEQ